jgi:hypothetical protein
MWIQQPLGQGHSDKIKQKEEGFINSLKAEKSKHPK